MDVANRPVILTIDDETPVRQSIKNFLEDYDFTVLEANRGQTGIELIAAEDPDLILVDLRMPGLDGLDVLAYVQKNTPDTPIIVVSGTGVITDAVEAIRLGAWDYLLKPITDMSILLHAVESALDKANLITQNRIYQQRLEELVAERTAALRATTEALRESEVLYRTLVENSPNMIFMESPDGRLLFVNDTFIRCTGYAKDIAQQLTDQDLLHPEDLRTYRQNRTALVSKLPVESGAQYRLKKSDRTHIPVATTHAPITDNTGQANAVLGIARDITDQVQAENDREELQAQLIQAQKMEALGQLTGGITHDFNNLLTAINGFAELLLMRMPADSKHRRLVANILKSGNRATKLVSQLLAFSRRQIIQPEIFDANQMISELYNNMLSRLLGEHITIDQDLCAELKTVKMDPTQFEQIVMNLVINSRDAMDNNGRLQLTTRNITLNALQTRNLVDVKPGHYICLAVTDSGVGIPPEVQARMFEPFFTTKKKGEGTGLGLSTVFGIVKQNMGHIEVDSVLGQGTTFSVYLPVAKPEDNTAKTNNTAESYQGTETILVVEDEDSIQEMATDLLRSQGYTVLTAAEAPGAVEVARNHPHPIHLLLTDMILPQTDGGSLAKMILKHHPGLNALFISGYQESILIERGLLQPGMAFLQKPFTLQQLSHLVRHTLDQDPVSTNQTEEANL